MAKVIWSKEAREDLEEIYLYLFDFSEKTAQT
jgi:plasmid stabilization system protein ParE